MNKQLDILRAEQSRAEQSRAEQSRAELLLGDCLNLMQTIPDGSVDMILCDLPYGTTNAKWDSIIDLGLLWEQYKRVIKTNGAILLFAQTPFDKVLGCSNLEWLRYEIIWQKTQPTGHLNAKKMPMKAHENILVFYEGLPTYNPQKTTGHPRKTSKSISRKQSVERQTGNVKSGESIYGFTTHYHADYDTTERYPIDVQVFAKDTQKEKYHPTQKPVALLEWLIKTYTNKGELVLDNCMGSGSTGVACVNTGRDFIGIEKDKKYFEIAKNRINSQGEINE